MTLLAPQSLFDNFLKSKKIYTDNSIRIIDSLSSDCYHYDRNGNYLKDDNKIKIALVFDYKKIVSDFTIVEEKYEFEYDMTSYVTDLYSYDFLDLKTMVEFNKIFPHININKLRKYVPPYNEDEDFNLPDIFRNCGNKYLMSIK